MINQIVEVEEFYSTIDEDMRCTRTGKLTIIMDDINANVGKGKESPLIGIYGIREISSRRNRLIQVCNENDLFIDTLFKQYPRLYTWNSPADNSKTTN